MTKWAYVENNEIKGVYDRLPTSWKNISGFNTLENDLNTLIGLGWYRVSSYDSYDSTKYNEMGYTFSIVNGAVVGTPILKEKTIEATPEPNILGDIRTIRDSLLIQSDIYQLADWQVTFDNTLKNRWLLYRAKLREVPQIYETTGNLDWPTDLNELLADSNSAMQAYLVLLTEPVVMEIV